ncbi:MAG TPA: hypothetical protein VF443_04345 [Nitrospira sp.]
MVAFTWQIEEAEMDAFEELCERLRKMGYSVHLNKVADGWQCELCCGVDVLKPEQPRPLAKGPTAFDAVENAASKIQPPKAKAERGTSLVSGLPRSN